MGASYLKLPMKQRNTKEMATAILDLVFHISIGVTAAAKQALWSESRLSVVLVNARDSVVSNVRAIKATRSPGSVASN